ncbi:hypothetical protein TNCV_2782621 [Trichonephila clavipes]|nr:hypothetical protein TNCV_2782621 [Trichonephila clavipes]
MDDAIKSRFRNRVSHHRLHDSKIWLIVGRLEPGESQATYLWDHRVSKKYDEYSMETVHRDRNSGPTTWPRPHKDSNADSRLLFETFG